MSSCTGRRWAWPGSIVIVPIFLAGCEPSPPPTPGANAAPTADAANETAKVPEPLPPPACPDPIPVYESGDRIGAVCEADAGSRGLTILDLSDEWTPRIFAPAGDDPGPSYRETFVRLADERLGDGPEWDRPKADRFLELYGIFPTLRVMAARLGDEKRHACHDAIDDGPIERLEKDVDPWADRERQKFEAVRMRALQKQLEHARKKAGAADVDALRSEEKFAQAFRELDRVSVRPRAIAAVQAHLRCEGLLTSRVFEGAFDHATTDAMRAFQRKLMVVSYSLDAETRTAFATGSRELDFRGLLRVLRERVVDATGLVEDGSASGSQELVVGRELDSVALRAKPRERGAVAAAPDLVGRATDAAARALGWTSPETAAAFLDGLGEGGTLRLRVAVRLPAPPEYHAAEMDLRAEIDRGDVWYEFPYTKGGDPAPRPPGERPTLTLYVKHAGVETALVRWPTTIGGWKAEKPRPKEVVLAYKLSPPGPRVWRDLFVAPVWIPPENAPKRELVRQRPDGSWATKSDLFGPGYASAYGLTMLVHHQRPRRGASGPGDEGIRTHGSVSYASIHSGTSHGCHRLFNHLAIRLSSYLLAHRKHERRGPDVVGYGRRIEWQKKALTIAFDSRGYRYELDPPVPVEVTNGRIMGKALGPLPPQSLPKSLEKVFVQDRFE